MLILLSSRNLVAAFQQSETSDYAIGISITTLGRVMGNSTGLSPNTANLQVSRSMVCHVRCICHDQLHSYSFCQKLTGYACFISHTRGRLVSLRCTEQRCSEAEYSSGLHLAGLPAL